MAQVIVIEHTNNHTKRNPNSDGDAQESCTNQENHETGPQADKDLQEKSAHIKAELKEDTEPQDECTNQQNGINIDTESNVDPVLDTDPKQSCMKIKTEPREDPDPKESSMNSKKEPNPDLALNESSTNSEPEPNYDPYHCADPKKSCTNHDENRRGGPNYTYVDGHMEYKYPLLLTKFIAVTAYQNENIIKSKIDHNPFAKAFRNPLRYLPK